jgi:hypothetical protein
MLKNKKYCIITSLFNENFNYRENIILKSILTNKSKCDVYYINGYVDTFFNADLNFIKCFKLFRLRDSYLAFNIKILKFHYDVAFINDARQLFTVFFSFILYLFKTKIIYEHEQRSDGLSFIGKIYSIIFVRFLIKFIAKRAFIIRVANQLSEDYLKICAPEYMYKIIEIPLAIDIEIFNEIDRNKTKEEKLILCWTGKNPNKKNINLILSAIELLDNNIKKNIEFIVFSDDDKLTSNFEFVKIYSKLLSIDELADLYKSAFASIWTTPTQSYFESAACGNYVICPISGIPKSIEIYTNSFIGVDCICNKQGLALISEINIQKYKNAILNIHELWINKNKPSGYNFSGDDYFKIINQSL